MENKDINSKLELLKRASDTIEQLKVKGLPVFDYESKFYNQIQKVLPNKIFLEQLKPLSQIENRLLNVILEKDGAFQKAVYLNSFIESASKFTSYTNALDIAKLVNIPHHLIKSVVDSRIAFEKINWDDYLLDDQSENETEEKQTSGLIYLNDAKLIKNLIHDIYLDNAQMYLIKPREFEKVVAELLRNYGFEVELTKATRDGGYDIMALHKMGQGLLPIKYLIECKRYREDNGVGVEVIRSLRDVIRTNQAHMGILFTTSYFTKDANKLREETPLLLDFKDKEDLVIWINEYECKKVKRA